MIVLPTERKKVNGLLEPRKMLIFSAPKIGKTEMCSFLPESLIVDLESGSTFYECAAIDVKNEANKEGKHPIMYYLELAATIKKANQDAGKKIYDYIIIDPLTILEDMSTELATNEYKKSAIGKNFTGTNIVTELAQGSGYGFQRIQFERLYKAFDNLAEKCLVLLAHVKVSSIAKKGDTLIAKDISLTGKLKTLITSDMDAIGYLYRNKTANQNILSFLSEEQDLATGSRVPYLSGKEIVISEKIDGKLITHWDLIFPSLKEQK